MNSKLSDQDFYRLLGFIESGFGIKTEPKVYNPTKEVEIKVTIAENSPYQEMHSYCTIGLNEFPMTIDDGSDLGFRVELMLGSNPDSTSYSDLLIWMSQFYINETVLFPGTVMRGAVKDSGVKNNNLPNAYVTYPFGWLHNFEFFQASEYDIRFLLILPISNNEMEYLSKYGKDKFEDLLVEKEVDVFNFHRESIL